MRQVLQARRVSVTKYQTIDPFAQQVQLLLADTQAETLLQSLAENEPFFYEVEAPLSMLLDVSFLENNLTKSKDVAMRLSLFTQRCLIS
jgi:hypothetical protein